MPKKSKQSAQPVRKRVKTIEDRSLGVLPRSTDGRYAGRDLAPKNRSVANVTISTTVGSHAAAPPDISQKKNQMSDDVPAPSPHPSERTRSMDRQEFTLTNILTRLSPIAHASKTPISSRSTITVGTCDVGTVSSRRGTFLRSPTHFAMRRRPRVTRHEFGQLPWPLTTNLSRPPGLTRTVVHTCRLAPCPGRPLDLIKNQ